MKKYSVAKNILWYSGYPLNKICTSIHCSLSDKAPISPKRILKVDLSYLPKILESNNMFQILGSIEFCIEGA